MKHYQGRRTIDGIMVTVDGEPLDTRYDLEQFTFIFNFFNPIWLVLIAQEITPLLTFGFIVSFDINCNSVNAAQTEHGF